MREKLRAVGEYGEALSLQYASETLLTWQYTNGSLFEDDKHGVFILIGLAMSSSAKVEMTSARARIGPFKKDRRCTQTVAYQHTEFIGDSKRSHD